MAKKEEALKAYTEVFGNLSHLKGIDLKKARAERDVWISGYIHGAHSMSNKAPVAS